MVTRGLTRPAWATRQRVLGTLALLGYGAFVVKVLLSLHGVPASRDLLVPIMLGGFLAVSVTSVRRMRRLVVGLLLDWTPFVLSLWLYDLIRGMADGAWLGAQFSPQIRFDETIGGGTTPTVWLQQHLWHGASGVRWYDYATWVVYMSYFFGTTAVLAVLWWRSRALFRRFAANVVLLAFVGCATFFLYPADPPWLASEEGHIGVPVQRLVGCATFVLYPADPPWLAAQEGHIDAVQRLVAPIGGHVPLVSFDALWETGTRYANNVAAMPSLHAAYTLLISLFLVRRLRSRWRHLLWLYPPAMAFALVYTGEHYVADIVAGWIYCVAVYAAIEWATARWERRRAAKRVWQPETASVEGV